MAIFPITRLEFGQSENPSNEEDMDFGFLEDFEESPEYPSESNGSSYVDDEEELEEESSCSVEENKAFWDAQFQLLKSTLYRSNSTESKIRQDTKRVLEELNTSDIQCVCWTPTSGGCRNCLRRKVCEELSNIGHDCSVCKSKWRTSHEIPSGEHTYLEVLHKSSSKRGDLRIIVELNFRAEFELARASEEYKTMISLLPEVYVGKSDRLKEVIKILCGAAKKCSKEKKMHLGPWRKHKFVQAKWFGTYDRTVPAPLMGGLEKGRPKPKASMLTFDLIENVAGLQSHAIRVVC